MGAHKHARVIQSNVSMLVCASAFVCLNCVLCAWHPVAAPRRNICRALWCDGGGDFDIMVMMPLWCDGDYDVIMVMISYEVVLIRISMMKFWSL